MPVSDFNAFERVCITDHVTKIKTSGIPTMS